MYLKVLAQYLLWSARRGWACIVHGHGAAASFGVNLTPAGSAGGERGADTQRKD